MRLLADENVPMATALAWIPMGAVGLTTSDSQLCKVTIRAREC